MYNIVYIYLYYAYIYIYVYRCLFCDYVAKQDSFAREFQGSRGELWQLENGRFDGWVIFNRVLLCLGVSFHLFGVSK